MPHGTVRSSIPRLRASKRGYGSIWTKVDPRTHLHLVHIVNFEWSVLLIGVFLGVDRVPLMEEWKDAGRALEIEIWIPFQKHDRDESPREPHLLLDTELKIVIKPTVRKVYFNSIIWTRLMRAANPTDVDRPSILLLMHKINICKHESSANTRRQQQRQKPRNEETAPPEPTAAIKENSTHSATRSSNHASRYLYVSIHDLIHAVIGLLELMLGWPAWRYKTGKKEVDKNDRRDKDKKRCGCEAEKMFYSRTI